MYILAGQSNYNSTKQQHFVVDATADIAFLPTVTRGAMYPYTDKYPKTVPMGSTAYVIATGVTYILSSDPEVNWAVCQNPAFCNCCNDMHL